MNELELAWAAGFFEGEGSVRISKASYRNYGALIVSVTNTDLSTIEFLHDRWGGSVHAAASIPPRRAYWRWTCASWLGAIFLEQILPYMRTNKYRVRALLGIEYQAQKRPPGRGAMPVYLAGQVAYYDRMAVLNIRGVPVA